MKIDKSLLFKYFKGDADDSDVNRIIDWVSASDENKKEFSRMKVLWDISGDIPKELCDVKIENISSKRRFFRFAYISAAAVIIILLVLNLFISVEENNNTNRLQTIAQNESGGIVTVYTNKGVKGFLYLPDSTKVWMNSDSKLKYPAQFRGKSRDVSMSGEIYFEVMKDKSVPMNITTNKGLTIEVRGTTLLVKSYDNDCKSVTTLLDGSIILHYHDGMTTKEKWVEMKPNESVTCNDNIMLPPVKKIKMAEAIEKQIAWKDGTLVFENTPMREVIKMLERWYGAEFIVKNDNVYNYRLTSDFKSESLSEVVTLMKYCMPVKFKVDDNRVTIY